MADGLQDSERRHRSEERKTFDQNNQRQHIASSKGGERTSRRDLASYTCSIEPASAKPAQMSMRRPLLSTDLNPRAATFTPRLPTSPRTAIAASMDYSHVHSGAGNKRFHTRHLRQSQQKPKVDYRALVTTNEPVHVPQPANDYLARSLLTPSFRSASRPLLVVLDLNGTLVARSSSKRSFVLRPGIDRFLSYVFEHHVPMVFTSARPENAKKMCDAIFNFQQREKLAAIWTRDRMGLTRYQYREKVQVYKRLEIIWKDEKIQSGRSDEKTAWSQANTVLIDDSTLKALSQPHNLLLVDEFRHADAAEETDAPLEELIVKLEELKMQVDVSRLIRRWQDKTVAEPLVAKERIGDKKSSDLTQSFIGKGQRPPSPDLEEFVKVDKAGEEQQLILGSRRLPIEIESDEDDEDNEVQDELRKQMSTLRTR